MHAPRVASWGSKAGVGQMIEEHNAKVIPTRGRVVQTVQLKTSRDLLKQEHDRGRVDRTV